MGTGAGRGVANQATTPQSGSEELFQTEGTSTTPGDTTERSRPVTPEMILHSLEQVLREVRRTPGKKKAAPKALTLEKYDGTTVDWADFEQRLDIVGRSNGWNEEEKGL